MRNELLAHHPLVVFRPTTAILWQRRYWEHQIRDEADLERHVNYIYCNPVKHGLVQRVRDWPFTSFHRDVQQGISPLTWAGFEEGSGGFGE